MFLKKANKVIVCFFDAFALVVKQLGMRVEKLMYIILE